MASCSSQPINTPLLVTQDRVNSPSITTEDVTATSTLLPFPEKTSTYQPTKTITPQLTSKQTPDMRLAVGKENLMKVSIKCDEICFWGIIPNKSTLLDAKNILNQAEIKLSETTLNHYAGAINVTDDLRMDIVLRTSGIISDIRVEMGGFDQPGVRRNDWSAYWPDKILQTYGTPTKIAISIDTPHDPPYNPDNAFLDLLLFYEKQNLTIQYVSGIVEIRNGSYQFCPEKFAPRSINIWVGANAEYAPRPSQFISQEKLTSLSDEEFVNMVLGTTPSRCANIPIDTYNNAQK